MEKGAKLGFWSIVLLGINAIIGSGIFGLPGDAYTNVGPSSILVLGFCMILAVSISLFYAFTGFESLAVAAKDMENPKKNVPKALVTVMFVVSVIYVLILAISIGVLGDGLVGSSTPVADAATKMLGPIGGYVITIGTIVSVGGINIASSIFTPRSAKALVDQGLMPKSFSKTNKNESPYIAVIVSVIGTLLIAWSGSFTTLSQISVVSRFIQYIPTCLTVLILSKKYAGKEVNFKIPGGAIIPVFAVAVSIVLLIKAGIDAPMKIVWGLGGMIFVVPIYLYMTKVYSKKNNNVRA